MEVDNSLCHFDDSDGRVKSARYVIFDEKANKIYLVNRANRSTFWYDLVQILNIGTICFDLCDDPITPIFLIETGGDKHWETNPDSEVPQSIKNYLLIIGDLHVFSQKMCQ